MNTPSIRSPQHWRERPIPKRRPALSLPLRRFRFPRPRLFRSLFIIAALCIIIGGSTLTVAVAWVSRSLPNPENIVARRQPQSTRIYDRTGTTLLYEVSGGEKRTYKKISEIPSVLKWSTIVVEDKDFYSHGGFDLRGILRAVFVNLREWDKAQGGSTITQQLIKKTILTSEKAYTRKVKEVILAIELERRFSKDAILEMYLNEINYGGPYHGVESASTYYFGKSVGALSIAEAAALAALPQAPSRLSPYGSHTDELFRRQQFILLALRDAQYITEEEYATAKDAKLVFRPKDENILAPHFVLWVRELLSEKYGEKHVAEGGLRIITTLDWTKQQDAQTIIADIAPKNEKNNRAGNAALVALDPKTGQILAMVGSRDYFEPDHDGNVNVALRPRQPGSSFKPIVYTAAFEKGYTPDTQLFDVVTAFPTDIEGEYTPLNYTKKEYGIVTMRKALAGSLNIPAVKTLYLVGIGRVLDFAERLGYTTLSDRSRFGLSLVLGGGEVTLLEHTAAYATLSQEGVAHTPSAILRVEDKNGTVLEEWQPSDHRVLDANVARKTTSILTDNNARAYMFGAKNLLILPDRLVAAKTGTTNDFRDAWTMGYTPSLAVGVWAGNNDNTPMRSGADSSVVAAPIWNAFMRKALADTPVETFTPPDPDPVDKPVLRGEGLGTTTVRIDRVSGKLATQHTPTSQIEERTYTVLKPILHFVDKDDPRGPVPSDPGRDPYYEPWLRAIEAWGAKQGLVDRDPPTEEDDVHLPENRPHIEILTPSAGSTVVRGGSAMVTVNTSAVRGVRRVDYFLDDVPLRTVTDAPFSLMLDIPATLAPGSHTLRARASDDVDNIGETTITIIVQ